MAVLKALLILTLSLALSAPVLALEHPVQAGETLSGLSISYGVPASEIAALNAISDPDLILAGSVLQIPSRARPSTRGERVAEIATSHLGVPYVWGGSSPDGWDCVGFVRYTYLEAGIDLGTNQIPALYEFPDPGSPGPGDLVFFTNTYKPGLSHVGIYDHAGRFVHAAAPEYGTITSSLTNSYWSERYAGARRP